MSPEILAGTPFGLSTDIFSLGVIMAEIAARHLADDTHFARQGGEMGVDFEEVKRRASPGCPEGFLELIGDCLKMEPVERPVVNEVLERLRVIELEVASRPETGEEAGAGHVGSVKFVSRGRRPGAAPRIPSFGVGVGKGYLDGGSVVKDVPVEKADEEEEDAESDEELAQAVLRLNSVDLGENVWHECASSTLS